MIINNLGRTGEVIHWNQNQALDGDEIIGLLFKDVILLNVINLRPQTSTIYIIN